jgi:hypothetical protein
LQGFFACRRLTAAVSTDDALAASTAVSIAERSVCPIDAIGKVNVPFFASAPTVVEIIATPIDAQARVVSILRGRRDGLG